MYVALTRASLKGGIYFTPNQHGGRTHSHKGSQFKARYVTTMWNNAARPNRCRDGSFKCYSKRDFSFDYAVIQLYEDAGNTFGWLGLGYTCRAMRYSVRTAGYPSDKPDYPLQMYTTEGTLESFNACSETLDNQVITSNLDTAPGQSGSAIWDISPGWRIRAINVSRGPGHRAITRGAFQRIRDWVYNK